MDKIISEASNHKVKNEIPQKWEFWLKIQFKSFTQNKNPTKKSLNMQKIKKKHKRRPKIKKVYERDPPKVEIMIENIILKFSKT